MRPVGSRLLGEQPVDGALDLAGVPVCHVRVGNGSADVRVAQELLDVAEVSAGLQKMGGEGVTEHMGGDPSVDAGSLRGPGHFPLNGSGGDVSVPAVPCREEPMLGSFPTSVLSECVQNHRGEHDVSVFPTLSLADSDLTPLAFDVRHPESGRLADPKASGVEDHGNGTVFRGSQGFQKGPDLVLR